MQVTVIGAGYVGLVTAAALASAGHEVAVVDIDVERIATINTGKAPFHEPGLNELIEQELKSGRLSATKDLKIAMQGSDISIVAVPTPLQGNVIDLSYVKAAVEEVGKLVPYAAPYHIVVVKSTVVPGTTGGLVRQLLERHSGMQAGAFGLCVNPEFLREGNAVNDFTNPDRIIIGQLDQSSGLGLMQLYKMFDCPKLITNLQNAELIKYTTNAFLATLISFSNEIANLCSVTPGADVEIVLEGLHLDRRLNYFVGKEKGNLEITSYLRAGSGYGGSCLPKDLTAIRNYARNYAVPMPLLEAVANINDMRPRQVIDLVKEQLGALAGKTIAVFGLAFKPGTADLRESPALKIVSYLCEAKANIKVYDPLVRQLGTAGVDFELCAAAEDAIRGVDALVIATASCEFTQLNWAYLCSLMKKPIIIDGRNVLRKINLPYGVFYRSLGYCPEKASVVSPCVDVAGKM